jgi:hypothetical protein
MSYRDTGGPAPIHSALFKGTDHRSDGLTRPELDYNKPDSKAAQRWNLTQRPFYWNPFS